MLVFAAAAAIIVTVGCGGGGSTNRYAGVWTPEASNGSLTITSDGHMSMAIQDESVGGTDTYSCRVDSNGDFHGTMTNPNIFGTLNANGTIDRISSDELFVHIRVTDPDTGDSNTADETFFRSGSAHAVTAKAATGTTLSKILPKVK